MQVTSLHVRAESGVDAAVWRAVMPRLPALRQLHLDCIPNCSLLKLSPLASLPLTRLVIDNCPALEYLPDCSTLTGLRELALIVDDGSQQVCKRQPHMESALSCRCVRCAVRCIHQVLQQTCSAHMYEQASAMRRYSAGHLWQ